MNTRWEGGKEKYKKRAFEPNDLGTANQVESYRENRPIRELLGHLVEFRTFHKLQHFGIKS